MVQGDAFVRDHALVYGSTYSGNAAVQDFAIANQTTATDQARLQGKMMSWGSTYEGEVVVGGRRRNRRLRGGSVLAGTTLEQWPRVLRWPWGRAPVQSGHQQRRVPLPSASDAVSRRDAQDGDVRGELPESLFSFNLDSVRSAVPDASDTGGVRSPGAPHRNPHRRHYSVGRVPYAFVECPGRVEWALSRSLGDPKHNSHAESSRRSLKHYFEGTASSSRRWSASTTPGTVPLLNSAFISLPPHEQSSPFSLDVRHSV